jgi:hypothetical protein
VLTTAHCLNCKFYVNALDITTNNVFALLKLAILL